MSLQTFIENSICLCNLLRQVNWNWTIRTVSRMKSSEFSKNIRKMHLVHKVHSSNQPCYAASSLGTEKTDSACTTHGLPSCEG